MSYGYLWATSVPRVGILSNYFNWWSDAFYDWAALQGKTWLNNRIQPVDRIVAIDVSTGQTRGTLITRPRAFGHLPIRTTPDGRYVSLVLQKWDQLVLVEVDTGCVAHMLGSDVRDPKSGTRWRHIAGLDDGNMYVVIADEFVNEWRLLAWNYEAGLSKTLEKRKPVILNNASRAMVGHSLFSPDRYCLVPHSQPPQFLVFPNWAFRAIGSPNLSLIEPATDFEKRFSLDIELEEEEEPSFIENGSVAVFRCDDDTYALRSFRLSNGKRKRRFQKPGYLIVSSPMAKIVNNGEWTVVPAIDARLYRFESTSQSEPVFPPTIFLAVDVRSFRTIREFTSTGPNSVSQLQVAPNSATFAALVDPQVRYAIRNREILIYSWTPQPHAATSQANN
ncbi:MAG TPA: hypothetical protein VJZ71_09645 [Phycisphaerae bacterium]|nr:hypothetical protein [Phycisphaerae bacterium]